MTVYTKLNEARKQFHALELKKTGHNKFAGYYYFELGDFLIPALKVFNAVGLCAVVSFYEKTARMVILDVTAPPEAERICIDSPMGSAALKGCHEVQNIGAVETYQRRYLWVAALEIVEHDALDSSEPLKTEPKRTGVAQDVLETNPALTAKQKDSLIKLAGVVKDEFAAYGAQGAFERIDEQGLDDIEKIFLSTQLPSNVRNPITAYSRSLHQKATA